MLLVAVLVEIVSSAPDLISIPALIALGLSVVAMTAVELRLTGARRTAVVRLVHVAAGISLTTAEAGCFASAVDRITARDGREPPEPQFVAVHSQPGFRLRLEWRHPSYVAALEAV